MKSETEDIELLARAILTEAREESDQMQAEAKGKAEVIRQRAREQAGSERKAILDRAKQDADRLRSQAVATAQLKARSMQLEHREKLLASVFEAVRKQLDAIKKRPDYDAIAKMLLHEALTELRVDRAEVSADEITGKSLKGALEEMSKELKGDFKLAGALEDGTGVVVDASEGKLHYDNTLETRLGRLQDTLRAGVYKVLTGEKP